MKTTLEHWLNALAGFELLELVTVPHVRIDILRLIRRELCAALEQSNSAAFRQKCQDKLLLVALELNELLPLPAVAA